MSEAIATRAVGLLKVEEARVLLAECKRADEAKSIRDKAAAVERYLREQKAAAGAVIDAGEIKIRAEIRCGEILHDMDKARGGAPTKNHSHRASGSPPPLRELGITHTQSSRWQQLAAIPPEKREAFIAERREKEAKLVSEDLRREHGGDVRRQERVERIIETSSHETPIAEIPNCPVLLADPPWRYEHVKTESRAIENQYPTMDLEAICALRPPAAENAVLFLWATSPKLEEALRVLHAWGFSYRTCAVWVKDKIGMGYWFRQQHELLLVGVRGPLPPQPPETPVSSVITSDRTAHSAKPEEVPALIERAYPTLPRVELFARKQRKGWHVWGNEASV